MWKTHIALPFSSIKAENYIQTWRSHEKPKPLTHLRNWGQAEACWLMPVIPPLWEAEQVDHLGQEFKTSLANMVKPHLYQKYKNSWAWWYMPVIPAIWEAEAGESPEPRRRRLQWAEIAPLHSSLGNRVRLSQKKKQTLFELIHIVNSLIQPIHNVYTYQNIMLRYHNYVLFLSI